MNIRKNIDYTDMYAALDSAMAENLSQVELYYETGKVVCQRTEKGAAVAAASYLSKQYPDTKGLSPRNLRRMRDFCRTYENQPDLLSLALQLGWTQNVVIMEADLSLELREWYLKAAEQFGWSKVELTEKIATHAHEAISFKTDEEVCDTVGQKAVVHQNQVNGFHCMVNKIRNVIRKTRPWMELKKGFRRRWPPASVPEISEEAKRIYAMLVAIQFAKILDFYRIIRTGGHSSGDLGFHLL